MEYRSENSNTTVSPLPYVNDILFLICKFGEFHNQTKNGFNIQYLFYSEMKKWRLVVTSYSTYMLAYKIKKAAACIFAR